MIYHVVITVDENHLDQIWQVANNLRVAGLEVEKLYEKVGIITGSIESTKRSNLASITGVSAVEDEKAYNLPPPDSKIQ